MVNQVLIVDMELARIPPGKQKRIRRINKNFIVLYFLIFVFLLIAGFALIKENNIELLPSKISQFEILSFSDSIKVLISLFSIYIAIEGVELNFRPFLSYSSKSDKNRNPKSNHWRVKISNNGRGSAIIHKIEYEFVVDKDKSIITNYDEIVNELKKISDNKKIDLMNISKGFSISNGETIDLFEFPNVKLEKIERFDLKLFFKSYLGELYYKNVYLLPLNKTTHNIVYE